MVENCGGLIVEEDLITKVSDAIAPSVVKSLLIDHTFGTGFRSEGDFSNAQGHTYRTLGFAKELLELEGTVEEKLKFIETCNEEVEKFHIKENKEDEK